ncbi:hypothetical protein JANAI62_16370 [Jannaschia pagri]|uniref:DUF2125 domain-containing protein n=1 Tax=Jannaschia pagri TaxID=2829797 RepID=A0ABQ4NKV5_9RHOB|nr:MULTISPECIES: DUF2125 domain-containing protein [unclassified Jannaschia]GIT91182.1 hypothetical protein JANAI61_16400 [Jannaschia sp. AI_61]GIT95014.1 hypothetical protein JANAI62_16370 [Jannaschia sp. AI_62]
MLRLLTILSLVAAILWGGWWLLGAYSLDRGIAAGLDQARDQGWRVTVGDTSVSGFPNRFDTQFTEVDVTTPDGLWGVAMPFLQVFALSYRPNDIIVVPATTATVTTPGAPLAISADDLRASASLSLSSQPDVERLTVVGTGLSVASADGDLALDRGQLALRTAAEPFSYDLAVSLAGMALEQASFPAGLPDRIDDAAVDVTATWDRPPAEGGRLVSLKIRHSYVRWDDIRVDAGGDIRIGPSGFPEGDLVVDLVGWQGLLPVLAQAGLPAGQVALLAGGLTGLEDNGVARVPLTLRGGQMLFGTIPLAALPRLPAPYNP